MDIEDMIKCNNQVRNEQFVYCLNESVCFMKDKKHMKLVRLYDEVGLGEYHNLPICTLYDLIKSQEVKQ